MPKHLIQKSLTLLIIMALFGASFGIFIPQVIPQAQAASWYDLNWTRRKVIQITENSGSSLSNYQVKISVSYESNMQPDFDDIRFTDSDGTTLLDYWRETYSASSSALFWIEVPTISASSTKTIYMYYGNQAVSLASNGENTFDLFDDFEGTAGSTPDTNKWIVEKKGSTDAIVELDGNGNLYLRGKPNTIASGNAKSKSTFINGFSIELKRKYSNWYYVNLSIGNGILQDMDNGGQSKWWHTVQGDGYAWAQQNYQVLWRTPSGANSVSLAWADRTGALNTYEEDEFSYDNSGNLKWIQNGTQKSSITDTNYLNSSKYLLLSQGSFTESGWGGDSYIDFIFVHKYVSLEPTYDFSSEEAAGEEETVPEFTIITAIIAAIAGFGIYFVIRNKKQKVK